MSQAIPCAIMRAGTSKGVFLLEQDLPAPGEQRDRLLMRMMGSPDIRQIDGIGGATSVTSKIAIVAPSRRSDADVDYTFAQVAVDQPVVSYAGNCGNMSSGVGPFAIECGLVEAADGCTCVRIYNTNTGKLMVGEVQTPGCRVRYDGDCAIAGVPGTAAPIKLSVCDPAGSVLGSLLPTGQPIDRIDVPGFGPIDVSIVDASNPLVFARAADLGLCGTELPADIDGDPKRLALLEAVRSTAAQRLGLVNTAGEAAVRSPGVPKMTIVAPPTGYTGTGGGPVDADAIDLCGRMMSMQRAHPTYAMTGAMCTAAAAGIAGTVVHQALRPGARGDALRIGHPAGIMVAGAMFSDGELRSVSGLRTARLLLRGVCYC